jgi:hypothetical protein
MQWPSRRPSAALTDALSIAFRCQALHDQQLVGRFVLQLDEVVNIGAAAKERYAFMRCAACRARFRFPSRVP